MLGPAASSRVCPCAAGELRGKDVASRRRLAGRGQPHDMDVRIGRRSRLPNAAPSRSEPSPALRPIIWNFALDAGMLSCHVREAEGGDR